MTKEIEVERKNIAKEYFKLVSEGKFKEGLRFFAPDCKTHNPYIAGSIETLTNAMITASKDMSTQRQILNLQLSMSSLTEILSQYILNFSTQNPNPTKVE